MLSIEIRVNGNPIGLISAYRGKWNHDTGGVGLDAEYSYPYRATFFPLRPEDTTTTYDGEVRHRYGDGMEKLAAKILGGIAENSPPVR